ncbi:MAG: hypothetical protein L0H73_18435 [Nitrococcus sp.]|nr:hypothetical protein [Nitrococcus sp.]
MLGFAPLAQCTGEVHQRGVHADDEIELRDDDGGIAEVVQLRAQILDADRGRQAGELGVAVIFLQAVESDTRRAQPPSPRIRMTLPA